MLFNVALGLVLKLVLPRNRYIESVVLSEGDSVVPLRSEFEHATESTPGTTPGGFSGSAYTLHENLEEVPSIWGGEGSHLTTTLGKHSLPKKVRKIGKKSVKTS